MKIGKQFKRMGKPSAKVFPHQSAAFSDPDAATNSGMVRIYLDDERPVPSGWVLARNPKAFFEAIEAAPVGKISAIALDWYLGSGITDGIAVAHRLVSLMREHPELFSGLEIVYLHSSDRLKAIEMMRIVEEPMREGWDDLPLIITHIGAPDMAGRNLGSRRSDARSSVEGRWL